MAGIGSKNEWSFFIYTVPFVSFIDNYTSKFKPSILNIIHNTTIHLATGTFPPNFPQRLYVKYGELPLVWMIILLL
jgi:hypothetical protein